MPKIALTKGAFAEVDPADFERLNMHKWTLHAQGYAYRVDYSGGGRNTILMHREVMEAPAGVKVDHEDGNRLNNRRYNLRLATQSQNLANRGANKNNSTGYKGVTKDKRCSTYTAEITVNREKIRRYGFLTAEGAAAAYNALAVEYFGEFAYLNEI